VLWDSVAALSPRASLEDNSQKTRDHAFSWIADEQFQKDFQAYLIGLKTAPDLVKDGIDLYTKTDLAGSEQSLQKSLDLDPGNSTAWYYLGLIAYARKDYSKAEASYLKAFQLGANAAIINYALGVNSFAAGRNPDATKYLNFAKQADKPSYGDKVDALLKRIDSSK
jgi:tetratricopeptide (TPR) repeat protein